jgi:pimeloyl-ACP methyl ester carboxylesterase
VSTITKKRTQIYFKDLRKGEPVVFNHGWPLSADAFVQQTLLSGLAQLSLHCPWLPRSRPIA